MSHHCLHDGCVVDDDQEHGSEVVEDVGKENESSLIDTSGEEVIAAGDDETLSFVVSPAQEWSNADEDRVDPDCKQETSRHARCDPLASQTLDNDIVPVITNHHHGHDGAGSKDSPSETIDLATYEDKLYQFCVSVLTSSFTQLSPHPVLLSEDVDDDGGRLAGHHAQV